VLSAMGSQPELGSFEQRLWLNYKILFSKEVTIVELKLELKLIMIGGECAVTIEHTPHHPHRKSILPCSDEAQYKLQYKVEMV
jgi:hypothetical protein